MTEPLTPVALEEEAVGVLAEEGAGVRLAPWEVDGELDTPGAWSQRPYAGWQFSDRRQWPGVDPQYPNSLQHWVPGQTLTTPLPFDRVNRPQLPSSLTIVPEGYGTGDPVALVDFVGDAEGEDVGEGAGVRLAPWEVEGVLEMPGPGSQNPYACWQPCAKSQ